MIKFNDKLDGEPVYLSVIHDDHPDKIFLYANYDINHGTPGGPINRWPDEEGFVLLDIYRISQVEGEYGLESLPYVRQRQISDEEAHRIREEAEDRGRVFEHSRPTPKSELDLEELVEMLEE